MGELTLARRLVVRLSSWAGRKRCTGKRVHSRRDVGVRLVTREPGLYGVRYERLELPDAEAAPRYG
jgi:hypothetical protein